MTNPQSRLRVTCFLHHPLGLSSRSGMVPLAEALGASSIYFHSRWSRLQRRSWTAGQLLRQWGHRYYGSTWNNLTPGLDELLLARKMPCDQDIAHFLWGEFASPRCPARFRKKATRLVGTFHASARRLPSVLKGFRGLVGYDAITLMSESQRQWFYDQGYPVDQMHVILHGVDTNYFRPSAIRDDHLDRPLRGLLVGFTERDHAFMAEVARKMPYGKLEMTILTTSIDRMTYDGIPNICFPDFMSDQGLLNAYQQADLLIMPMIDCTANNAILEAMACGTPVLTNRIGGTPEYVNPSCNFIQNEKNVLQWVDLLVHLSENRQELTKIRPAVRVWAEKFNWQSVAIEYFKLYQDLIGWKDQ